MKKECRIYALYSGSGGNSVYIRVGDDRILIDAGKSARALCKALEKIGEDIKNISAIFVTHEHTDHVSALEVLAKKYGLPIHVTEQSAKKFDRYPDSPVHTCLFRHGVEFCVRVGGLCVSSFRTPHDSNMSVGYRLEFELDGINHAFGIATDIGYVSEDIRKNLIGCDAVIIESNHDEEMLMTGPYPYDLKMRVASKRGHLSNRECADFICELAQSGTRAFMLAHLSRENNEPELAFDESNRAVCDCGAYVCVADPEEPVELLLDFLEGIANDKREAYNPWNA